MQHGRNGRMIRQLSRTGERSGLALITTIMVLAIVGTIVAAMVSVVMASVRTAKES